MPFLGAGALHIIIALFFAVHVVRTGQQMYWLLILFMFPLLGSIVYFVAIYLPDSRLQHGARRAVSVAAKVLDPERELREARDAFDHTPTAQNQMRLAAALLDRGMAEEAARNYEACLKGPFATDAEIRFGAARAFLECDRAAEALTHLEAIRRDDPRFRPEALSLLLGRAYAGVGRQDDARAEFDAAVNRFGTFEARAEYAIWAYGVGDQALAARLQAEIDDIVRRWNSSTRDFNTPTLRRLQAARKA